LIQIALDCPPNRGNSILVKIIEVFFNLLVGLLNEGVEFAFREVLAPTVLRYQDGIYGFELAAVDGDEFSTEQIAFPTEKGEGAADLLDCFEIVPSKVGYGLEVGCEASQKPHQFHVAVSLLLQSAA